MKQSNILIEQKGGAEMEKLTIKCPYCTKEIESLYPKQLDYNYKAHLISCPSNPSNSDKTNGKQ